MEKAGDKSPGGAEESVYITIGFGNVLKYSSRFLYTIRRVSLPESNQQKGRKIPSVSRANWLFETSWLINVRVCFKAAVTSVEALRT